MNFFARVKVLMVLFWWQFSRYIFSFFDFTSSLRARRFFIYLEFKVLLSTQWFAETSLERLRGARIRRFFLSAQKLPFWRDRLPDSEVDFDDIPLFSKQDILNNPGDALMNDSLAPYRFYQEHTSGSTGASLHFFEDTATIPGRVARYRRQRYWIEGDTKSRLIRFMNRERLGFDAEGMCLTAHPDELIDTAVRRMVDVAVNESEKGPVFIESIASYLLRAAQLINAYNLPRPKVTGLLVFGEKLYPAEIDFIEEVFGTKIFNRYSLREFSTIAQECRVSGPSLHVVSEHFLIEITDEEGVQKPRGEAGKIVVTSFDNYAMPFIRYDTGDYGYIEESPCPCGIKLPLLTLVGRESTTGKAVNRAFSFLSEKMVAAGQFQLTQSDDNRYHVELSFLPPYEGREVHEELVKGLREILGSGISIEKTSSIPLNANGKRILFSSKKQTRRN